MRARRRRASTPSAPRGSSRSSSPCRHAGVKLPIAAINFRDLPGSCLSTSAPAMDLSEKVGCAYRPLSGTVEGLG